MSDPIASIHDAVVASWIDALIARHAGPFAPAEFLKAVRALSVRYVERRAELPHRSALDSPGKRAAFAGYFAPLHFLTTRAVVNALGAASPPPSRIVDLGCGTGAASAAWSLAAVPSPQVVGVDRDAWVLSEAAWNWTTLGVAGRMRRADFTRAIGEILADRRGDLTGTAVLLAWSVNEIDALARRALLASLDSAMTRGASLLVIEPIARAASPWWDEWARAGRDWGGRADEWKFDAALPPALERLREAAGFRAQPLGARSLWRPGRRASRATID